jgi:hypothetical protein
MPLPETLPKAAASKKRESGPKKSIGEGQHDSTFLSFSWSQFAVTSDSIHESTGFPEQDCQQDGQQEDQTRIRQEKSLDLEDRNDVPESCSSHMYGESQTALGARSKTSVVSLSRIQNPQESHSEQPPLISNSPQKLPSVRRVSFAGLDTPPPESLVPTSKRQIFLTSLWKRNPQVVISPAESKTVVKSPDVSKAITNIPDGSEWDIKTADSDSIVYAPHLSNEAMQWRQRDGFQGGTSEARRDGINKGTVYNNNLSSDPVCVGEKSPLNPLVTVESTDETTVETYEKFGSVVKDKSEFVYRNNHSCCSIFTCACDALDPLDTLNEFSTTGTLAQSEADTTVSSSLLSRKEGTPRSAAISSGDRIGRNGDGDVDVKEDDSKLQEIPMGSKGRCKKKTDGLKALRRSIPAILPRPRLKPEIAVTSKQKHHEQRERIIKYLGSEEGSRIQSQGINSLSSPVGGKDTQKRLPEESRIQSQGLKSQSVPSGGKETKKVPVGGKETQKESPEESRIQSQGMNSQSVPVGSYETQKSLPEESWKQSPEMNSLSLPVSEKKARKRNSLHQLATKSILKQKEKLHPRNGVPEDTRDARSVGDGTVPSSRFPTESASSPIDSKASTPNQPPTRTELLEGRELITTIAPESTLDNHLDIIHGNARSETNSVSDGIVESMVFRSGNKKDLKSMVTKAERKIRTSRIMLEGRKPRCNPTPSSVLQVTQKDLHDGKRTPWSILEEKKMLRAMDKVVKERLRAIESIEQKSYTDDTAFWDWLGPQAKR